MELVTETEKKEAGLASTLNNSLAILDKRESSLREMVARFESLQISGVDDRAGYKAMDEARKALKTERVSLENDAFNMREPAIAFQKAVVKREKELVTIIKPLEERFQKEQERIDKEKEEIRQRIEREKADRIQNRINILNALNYGVDFAIISEMSDEKFVDVQAEAQRVYDVDQKLKAEQKAEEEKKRREEEERIKKEREELERKEKSLAEERDRLAAEQAAKDRAIEEERARIAEEQAANQRRIDELQAKLDRDREEREEAQRQERESMNEELRRHRKRILLDIGLIDNGDSVGLLDGVFSVKYNQLHEFEYSEFDSFVSNMRVHVEDAKKRAEEEEIERKRKEEQQRLDEEQRQREEEARKEARRPDKDKIISAINTLTAFDFPEVTSKEAIELTAWAKSELMALSKSIYSKAAEL